MCPRRNIAITFYTEKLECCDFPKVTKFDDIFRRFDTKWRVTDRQTDRHTDVLRQHSPRYIHSIAP